MNHNTYILNEHNIEKPLVNHIDPNLKPKIEIISSSENILEFDLKNVQPSFANAIRRILLSEIPIVAVDKVLMKFNTSPIPDETLASRIGLVPLKVDPSLFEYHTEGETVENSETTLVFELRVSCRNAKRPKSFDDSCISVERNVYSSHLVWRPIGNQRAIFSQQLPQVVHPDILLAKLAPGQTIDLTVLCRKGMGNDHAKFSPVATAFYRMMPYVKIKEPIYDEDAKLLQNLYPEGVIKLVSDSQSRICAVVGDPVRNATNTNVNLYENLKNKVEIGRIQHHYIFKIESTGCVPPVVLMRSALNVLKAKCDKYLQYNEKFETLE